MTDEELRRYSEILKRRRAEQPKDDTGRLGESATKVVKKKKLHKWRSENR